jgi:hypothetical protein
MRESTVPIEFEELSSSIHYVVERIRGKEWSSSCPKCGGEPHQSGEWPDRFRMWPKGKAGIPWGWCRTCDFKWFPKQDYKPDPAKIEQWKEERIAEEERRKSEAESALAILRNDARWKVYYEYLLGCDEAQKYWMEAGIATEYWWFEWQLGYDPEHEFWYDDNGWKKHTTATATIPVYDLDGAIVNIKHRLITPFPNRKGEKYRMEKRVGVETIFIANLPLSNHAEHVLLCEGEKKAMCTWLATESKDMQAFGLPASPSVEILKGINGKYIWYIPDPDVDSRKMKRVTDALAGREVRIASAPFKIDDGINQLGLGKDWMRDFLKNARWA